MAAVETKLSLKLLGDTKTHRVHFAETGKEFVDFLFNLQSLPIGSVITILSKQGMVGSLGKLYESVKTLSDTYKQASQVAWNALLRPTVYASAAVPPLLPNIQMTNSTRFYGCSRTYSTSCYNLVTNNPGVKCPSLGSSMDRELKYVDDPPNKNSCSTEEGYVKGVATWMI